MRKVEETHGLDVPVEPGVQVQLSDARLTLLVRVPVPVGQQANIEQAIIREFLEEFHGPLN
jgi:hypothetical protein